MAAQRPDPRSPKEREDRVTRSFPRARAAAAMALVCALALVTLGARDAGAQPPLPTPRPTTLPAPLPTLIPEIIVCRGLDERVPTDAISAAELDPASIAGYRQPCYPNRPPGPWNGIRGYLDLQRRGVPYHPLFNGLVWRCGCG